MKLPRAAIVFRFSSPPVRIARIVLALTVFVFLFSCSRTDQEPAGSLALEDESMWAMTNRLTAATKLPNYLDFIYLQGLRAVKPDAVRILR